MQENNLSKEAQTALWQMIRQTEGVTTQDLAQITGDLPNTICNYANINMPSHLPSLKKFEMILLYTQNPTILKVWADQLGFDLVPKQVILDSKKKGVIESLLNINVGSGQVNQKVLDVWADGIITKQEEQEAVEELENLVVDIHYLISAVKTQAAKYLENSNEKKA